MSAFKKIRGALSAAALSEITAAASMAAASARAPAAEPAKEDKGGTFSKGQLSALKEASQKLKSASGSLADRVPGGVSQRSGGAKTVLETLEDALIKFNVRPRAIPGKDWVRIPAIWRGSREFNVSVHMKTGVATDFANAPDGSTDSKSVYATLSFNQLMEHLDHTPGDISLAKPNSISIMNASLQRSKDAVAFFRKGTMLGTDNPTSLIGRTYLKKRGIPDAVIERIYKQVNVVKYDYGAAVLALPIIKPRSNGEIIGIQRIFLTPEGEKYGDDPKKMMGAHFCGNKSGGFLINGDRSRYKNSEIALAEGFETGLAVHAATGMPVYVLYDANGLRAVDEEYLSAMGVQSVLIAADNDDPDKFGRRAGQEAANYLANWMTTELNIPVRIALPPRNYTDGKKCDWLDIWVKDPAGASRLLNGAPVFTVKDNETEKPKVKAGLRGAFSR